MNLRNMEIYFFVKGGSSSGGGYCEYISGKDGGGGISVL